MIIFLGRLFDLLRQECSRIIPYHRVGRASCIGVLSLLLFTPFSAHAWGNTWVFPGAMPSGCSQKSSTTFTCDSLSLNGDTVTINTSAATTITFNGNLSIDQTSINASGSASNLTLTVNGTLNPGYNSNINANVIAYAVDNGSSATTFGGDIHATNGVVNLGYQNTVTGSITDTTGAIKLGTQVTVGGSIIGGTGKITVSDYSSITGAITSSTGDISLSTYVKAGGITSTSGDISIGYKGTIAGAVTSTSGSITLVNEATAVSLTSTSGTVTIQYSSYVCGDVTTKTGPIYLYNSGQVGGNITSTSGNISLQWMSRVGGSVTTGGTITKDSTSTTSDASLVIASCTGLVTSTPSGFNAFESSTASSSTTGVIQTKIAGSTFSLDIVALNGTTSQLYTIFAGTVTVDLVDGSSSSACSARSALGNSGTVTFATGNAGRLTANFPAGYSSSNAWRDVQVRMTYQQSSSSKVVACSTDHFAIRPASLSVAVTDTDWVTAGTSRTLDTTVTHKAGQPFTITATAKNSASAVTTNYSGQPSAVITQYVSPTTCSGSGCTLTTSFSSSSSSGTVISSASTYSEVGNIQIQLQDSSFASIDASDTSDSGRIITSSLITIGRFIPDHFALTTSTVTPGCSSGNFTYMSQPFSAFTYAIKAQNASNILTQNYDGSRATVALVAENSDSGTNLASRLTAPTGTWSSGTYTVTTDSSNPLAFRRRNTASDATTAPDGPFDSLQLGVKVTDTDGVLLAGLNMNATTAGDGGTTGADSVRLGDPTRMRFGRLKLYNAHGSDRLNLPVPMRAEYFNGTAFATNTADSCTSISSSNVAFTAYKGGLSTSTMPKSNTIAGGTFSSGIGKLRLIKPTSALAKRGSVDLCVDLGSDLSTDTSSCSADSSAGMPWLQGRWRGTTYEYDPKSRATFGVFKNANEFIYIREMY